MGITPTYYQILLYIWSIANVDWYKFFLTKIKKTYGDGNIFLCVKYLGRIVFTFFYVISWNVFVQSLIVS